MEKKGQVTLFIIIAIVIVGIIVGFFILKGGGIKKIFTSEASSVYLFVENCIEESGSEAVYVLGQGGGYSSPPNLSTSSGVAYYYLNDTSYMPSREEIEKEISDNMGIMLFSCIKNFSDFPDFEITQGEIKTETKIENNNVILNVEYPFTVIKGDDRTLFKEFENIKIPIRLGIIYDAVGEIIQEQLNQENICLSCVLDISVENDLYVGMLYHDEETIIFVIRDERSKINKKTFEFIFANKYENQEEE